MADRGSNKVYATPLQQRVTVDWRQRASVSLLQSNRYVTPVQIPGSVVLAARTPISYGTATAVIFGPW